MKKSLAKKILRGIGLAGLLVVAASSPYFGLNLIKGFKRSNDKKEWRKFYASLDYLNKRGYVRVLEKSDGRLKVKITRKGEDQIKEFDIDSLELKKQENWDGKWRVIIFDVPVAKNKFRLAFTDKIKDLGFVMIQKSVWAYPYECYEELMILRKYFNIEQCVSYFEAMEIEDERDWRGRFNLKHQ
ncbi:MAG: hypothetical protein Q7R60_00020 [bacterium]|nr:hypothetical protein [bacterium]